MEHKKFSVTGMTCSACSAHVEKAVAGLDGVSLCQVNLLNGSMVVEYDQTVTPQTIIDTVVSAGYGAEESTGEGKGSEAIKKHIAWMKKRLIVSLCFLVPLFYLAMGHMVGWWLPQPLHPNTQSGFYAFIFLQILLLIPIVIANFSYFSVGFTRLLKGSPNMDSLVAVGASAGIVYSLLTLWSGTPSHMPELYFESSGMILALVTVGKYLEARSKGKTGEAIASLIALTPESAVVVREGVEQTVPIGDVVIGDTIVVRQGTRIPVDGVVFSGNGAVDESAITGESLPVEKQAGDKVIAATINKAGFLTIQAEKVGKDTTLSQIITLMDEAASSKAPIAKLADRVSGIFVPVVMSISLLSFLFWFFLMGEPLSFSLSIAIAVLVISCPCALGLATPVAIMVGTGKAAQNGILIKSAEALEILHHVNTVVLDKTGTVTEGKPRVTDLLPAKEISEEMLLTLAASAEALSEHPLAEAVAVAAKERGLSLKKASDFVATPGGGVSAVIDGKTLLAGNKRLMEQQGIDLTAFETTGELLAEEGKTPLYFVYDGALLGVIAVADTIKPTSKAAIETLQALGTEVVLLTGDHRKTADAIGKRLGLTRILAEVLPKDKEQCVATLQEEGKTVAMVGDGINDAPALARADVGIAIGAGTDVAIESSDVVLMKSDLHDVTTAIALSKAVIRNIKENLFWAFFYNTIGIPIAAGVLYLPFGIRLDPMLAAAAMSLSSVCVVTNALRLKRFSPPKITIQQEIEEINTEKETTSMTQVITIKGMMCAHCSSRVEKALNDLPEVTKATVNLEAGTATVEGDVSHDALRKAVTDAGYEVTEIQ